MRSESTDRLLADLSDEQDADGAESVQEHAVNRVENESILAVLKAAMAGAKRPCYVRLRHDHEEHARENAK